MDDGLGEAMLGLDGFRVLQGTETVAELIIEVEPAVDVDCHGSCGSRAGAHDRTGLLDLPGLAA